MGTDPDVGAAESAGRSGLVWVAAAAVLVAPVLVVAAFVGVVLLTAMGSGSAAAAPGGPIPGLPAVFLDAYVKAATAAGKVSPGCTRLSWSVLAGLGQVESNQGMGRAVSTSGNITPPIIGPVLNGSGAGGNTTAIRDTDHGRWDGDSSYDRAVGPMQFIPSTWAVAGQDGNGDGTTSPNNIYDAALAAAGYLCGAGHVNLADRAALSAAIYRYNHSHTYVTEVLRWASQYAALGGSAGAAAPVSPVKGSGKGATIAAAAERWKGTTYVWGGGSTTGPTGGGFDCSGLALYAVYQATHQVLPHLAAAQAGYGTWIPYSQGVAPLQPGDLVFFSANPANKAGIHHVGIYLGGGRMIDAPHTGAFVREEPVWVSQYAGAARL